MDRYLSEREGLLAAAAPGIVSARRLARLTDEALHETAHAAALEHLPLGLRWSLVALGGYGSGALLPGSDLDLLVLSNAPSATLKPFVEALLYPLWDAGLKVGHQVRSRKEQVRAVREDAATLTATLTGRVIAGDETTGFEVLRACAADARKRRDTMLAALRDRDRPGSPYLLEPDLKEGAGGRRDFDELTWTAAVLTGAPQSDPSALVSLGLLDASEYARLAQAADIVAAARWQLQLAGSSSFLAEEFAADLRTDPANVQRALADTHHLLLRVRARLDGAEPGDAGPMSPAQLVFLAREGAGSLPLLEEAAWAGRLESLVPGFRDLMVLRRPGIAHTRTVGAHCLRTATLVGDIAHGRVDDHLVLRSAETCTDLESVVVAALVHDVGKQTPGPGHAERGGSVAACVARLFGMEERSAALAADLVRLHLLLAETVSSRDLDEEDAVIEVASAIGERALVPALHVLTVADSLATGPGAWSDWHAALLGKLVVRLDAALAEDVAGAGIAQRAEATRAAALEALATDDARRSFVARASLRYLADRPADEVVRHATLAADVFRAATPGAHAIDVSAGPLPHSFRVTVVAVDRPGLFATVAGVLALSGLDILAVDAHTTPSGIAVDTFTVRSATLAAVSADTWARVERSMGLALRDRLAVGVRLAERRRHYRSGARTVEPRLDVYADDPFATVLRVRVTDRVGLLHDIGKAIADSGLDIRSATALTRSGIAEDTFRLTDASGEPPKEAGALGQLRMRLRDLLVG